MILSYQAHSYGQITIWWSSIVKIQDSEYYPFINYILIQLILKSRFLLIAHHKL